MISNRKKGFTLIELLITITIIAVLSLIAITSYVAFTKNARNAKRQSDLKFIQSALEEYFADQRVYPTDLTTLSTHSKKYMTTVPLDPLGVSANYLYTPNSTNSNYCLSTKFEGTSPPTSNCTPTDPAYTYSITRP